MTLTWIPITKFPRPQKRKISLLAKRRDDSFDPNRKIKRKRLHQGPFNDSRSNKRFLHREGHVANAASNARLIFKQRRVTRQGYRHCCRETLLAFAKAFKI